MKRSGTSTNRVRLVRLCLCQTEQWPNSNTLSIDSSGGAGVDAETSLDREMLLLMPCKFSECKRKISSESARWKVLSRSTKVKRMLCTRRLWGTRKF